MASKGDGLEPYNNGLLLCTITYPFYRKPANKMVDEIIQKPYTVGHGDTYWQIKGTSSRWYKRIRIFGRLFTIWLEWSGIKAHELKRDIILLPFF